MVLNYEKNNMKNFTLTLALFLVSIAITAQNDSLIAYTMSDLLSLSNQIQKLEKDNEVVTAPKAETELPQLKMMNDSVYLLSVSQVVNLSNYLYSLEQKDSARLEKLNKSFSNADDAEYILEEEGDENSNDEIVAFHSKSSFISPEALGKLNAVAAKLSNTTDKISIEGYTDNIGAPTFNKWLGEKRALAVKKFLVSKGIDAKRIIKVEGYGGIKYLTKNDSPDQRAANRVVVIKSVK